MGTLTQGVVQMSDRDPAGPVGQPIPVAHPSLAQAGDVWSDVDDDRWLAALEDHGEVTLGLCRWDGTVPGQARRLNLPALADEYGPLTLRRRRGQDVSGPIRVERPL